MKDFSSEDRVGNGPALIMGVVLATFSLIAIFHKGATEVSYSEAATIGCMMAVFFVGALGWCLTGLGEKLCFLAGALLGPDVVFPLYCYFESKPLNIHQFWKAYSLSAGFVMGSLLVLLLAAGLRYYKEKKLRLQGT